MIDGIRDGGEVIKAQAEPYDFQFDPATAALLIIDCLALQDWVGSYFPEFPTGQAAPAASSARA